ncbi:MAG: hypothetical protein V4671_06700 [Armatimonadota bacterium]
MEKQQKPHGEKFDYIVDDEPQSTDEKFLTPTQILTKAGIDATTHYLKQVTKGEESISYQNEPNAQIKMKNHLKFISVRKGPTTVS